MQKQRKSLGESLVDEGVITAEQLNKAKEEEKRSGQRLRKALVKLGIIAEEDLVAFLGTRLGLPRVELDNYLIDQKVIDLVPEESARKYELIPVLKIGNRLTCAMVDPWNVFALDDLRMKTGLIIEPAVATTDEIKKALSRYYGARGGIEEIIKAIDAEGVGIDIDKSDDIKKIEEIVAEPVIIKLVNLIIMKAVSARASDIHIEPEKETLRLRFRIDGMLQEEASPPKHLQSTIISRIKIMARLDIAERRAAQDGRFSVKIEGRDIDIRVSCVPTIYGENIVLRILDVSNALLGLDQLGFSKDILGRYHKLIIRPHGIILVTGPTGSGKTTTLYASLNEINKVEKNIITIEDPVEYKLEGVRQIQVNPNVEMTFAGGLRSILRQDPDIIMVGEIRDFETAEIAVHAALTGHLVFSTLHTNDAAGAVTRMLDMRVEPYLLSSSVIGVLAQRLVRTICKDCKEEYAPTEAELKGIGILKEVKLYRGKGCDRCRNSGYKGRIGIFELMPFDDNIRNLVTAKAALEEIRKQAVASGMVTLTQDGIDKVKQGLTTTEEVLRVTREE
ncbi:MAG: type II secretion system ATPase GspE [Candidatus Omnitrophica bacterium]|nr:type II secretion system ATPase GspE [Candidatus Omnitrophota bacterium]